LGLPLPGGFTPFGLIKSFRFSKRGFESKSLVLLLGLSGGQMIHILAAPLLTRLFAPEAFGVLGVYMSVSAIIAVVSGLRYEGALMITTKPIETANLAALCFLASFLVSVLSFGAVAVICGLNLNVSPQITRMGSGLYLVPLAVFTLYGQSVLRLWWIRLDQFKSVSCVSFLQALIENGVKVAAGVAGLLGPMGLILGHVAGATAGLGYLLSKFAGYEPRGGLLRSIRKEEILAAGFRYRRFPLYNSWSSLVNVVSIQVPVLMLGWTFDIQAAGFYLLAQRVWKLPLRILGQAVSDALFKDLADRRREKRPVLPFVRRVLCLLAGVICLPLSAMLFGGEAIFEAAFGAGWKTSGAYAAIMSPWIAMQFLSSAVSSVFSVLERNRLLSALQVMLLAATLAPFLLARRLGYDHLQTVVLLSAFSFVAYSAYGAAAVWICHSHDRSMADRPTDDGAQASADAYATCRPEE